ncbi:hypothetical protein GCM10009000_005110 [Halobacterium noricense]
MYRRAKPAVDPADARPDRPTMTDITTLLDRDDTDAVRARLADRREGDARERKDLLRALRSAAEDDAAAVGRVADAVVPYLTDPDRAVRLSTAKVFVAVAERSPERVVRVRDALAERLADEDEFYYVRARAAEALGYAAVADPAAVASPELLADLRIGLAFDEREVREKLAKALEHVALADPDRLRHRVADLAEHLDDDAETVRYHLLAALVVVGCVDPGRLTDARGALVARLDDESPYVRGRAAGALGLLARADDAEETEDGAQGIEDDAGGGADAVAGVADDLRAAARVEEADGDATRFVADRVRFALASAAGVDAGLVPESDADPGQEPEGVFGDDAPEDDTCGDDAAVGTVEGVRATSEAAVTAIRRPNETRCPHCGTDVPDTAPICPVCGSPR